MKFSLLDGVALVLALLIKSAAVYLFFKFL